MKNEKTFHYRHLPHFYPNDSIFFVTFRLAGSLPLEVIGQLKEINNAKSETKVNWEHKFTDYDKALDKISDNIRWLSDERIAKIVFDAIQYRDKKDYILIAFCIMPNHVHIIFGIGNNDFADVGQNGILSKKDRLTICPTSDVGQNDILSKKDRLTICPTSDVGQNDILSKKADRLTICPTNKSLSKILQSLKRYTARKANMILKRTGSFWQDESYDHVIRDENELEKLVIYVMYNPLNAGLVKDYRDWKWSYCMREFEAIL